MNKIYNIFKHELFPPCLLIFFTFLALVFKNTSLSDFYDVVVSSKIGFVALDYTLIKPIVLWVNDGLIAIFFFWVGLEVKKELIVGELNTIKTSALPLMGAIGGVVMPSLVFIALNYSNSIALKGFAIPSGTDTAFAVGILLLLGRKASRSMKVFLLSLAIFDDIMAIVIIAIFYTNELSFMSFVLAGVGLCVLLIFNILNICIRKIYAIVGIFIWLCVLKSGVHATLAGMLCAFFIPLYDKNNNEFLNKIIDDLTPYINYFILPIFALFNAGIGLGSISIENFNMVFFGVFFGLVIGKQIGVYSMCQLAFKLGIARPFSNSLLYGVSLLTGIGFTMSFFISTLVYEKNELLFNSAKLGVLSASFISAVCGYIWIRFFGKEN